MQSDQCHELAYARQHLMCRRSACVANRQHGCPRWHADGQSSPNGSQLLQDAEASLPVCALSDSYAKKGRGRCCSADDYIGHANRYRIE
jgi:hypothetical protein